MSCVFPQITWKCLTLLWHLDFARAVCSLNTNMNKEDSLTNKESCWEMTLDCHAIACVLVCGCEAPFGMSAQGFHHSKTVVYFVITTCIVGGSTVPQLRLIKQPVRPSFNRRSAPKNAAAYAEGLSV